MPSGPADALTRTQACDCGRGVFTVVHLWRPAMPWYSESRSCEGCGWAEEFDSPELPDEIRQALYERDGVWLARAIEPIDDIVGATRRLMELREVHRSDALAAVRSRELFEGTKAEAEHVAAEMARLLDQAIVAQAR